MPGKNRFNRSWITKDNSFWLKPCEGDIHKATCFLCKSNFDIGSNGQTAILRHANGKKHKAVVNAKRTQIPLPVTSSATEKDSSTSKDSPPTSKDSPPTNVSKDLYTSTSSEKSNSSSANQIQSKDCENFDSVGQDAGGFVLAYKPDVIKAEILWCINKVITHSSFRCAGNITKLFALMFPDSYIARNMHLQRHKIAYSITYGLGPYFQDELLSVLKNVTYFSISIDESLNKVSQKAQLDMIIRYWDKETNQSTTRYLDSLFLEKCTAECLLNAFKKGLQNLGLNIHNLVQLAMDGPNVNLRMFADLLQFLENDGGAKLLEMGTCTLHIVHGAFKTGHSKVGWKINRFLRSSYYLFKNFSSRRAEFISITGTDRFPLKFCGIRWVENCSVIRRMTEILPHLRKYINETKKFPDSSNYRFIKRVLEEDKLLDVKLEFMLSVGTDLEHFLTAFQSDKPMLPFLYKEMRCILQNIGKRFLSKVNFKTTDVSNDENLFATRNVNVGIGAKIALKKKTLVQQTKFKEEAQNFLKVVYLKLLEKFPLSNKVIKGASALSPDILTSDTNNIHEKRIDLILEELVGKNIFSSTEGDRIKRDYLVVSSKLFIKQVAAKFAKTDRLDVFYTNLIAGNPDLFSNPFITFIKLVNSFFHGNADVERGFSVNEQCLVENLSEASLKAQRVVYDRMKTIDFDLERLEINQKMINRFLTSGTRRNQELKKRKRDESETIKERNQTLQELGMLEMKKKRLLEEKEEEVSNLDSNIAYLKSKLG